SRCATSAPRAFGAMPDARRASGSCFKACLYPGPHFGETCSTRGRMGGFPAARGADESLQPLVRRSLLPPPGSAKGCRAAEGSYLLVLTQFRTRNRCALSLELSAPCRAIPDAKPLRTFAGIECSLPRNSGRETAAHFRWN